MQMKTCIELGNAKGHFTFTIVANPPSVPTIHFSFPSKLPFHSLKMQYIEQDKTENVVQIYDREFRSKSGKIQMLGNTMTYQKETVSLPCSHHLDHQSLHLYLRLPSTVWSNRPVLALQTPTFS